MNYELAYELTYFNINYESWFFPFILVIFAVLFPGMYIIANKQNGNERYNSAEMVSTLRELLLVYFIIPLLLFSIFTTTLFVFQYKNIFVPYRNGNYQIVEGGIEDYIPMPYEGRGYKESFSIGAVKFEYSDYDKSGLGYNRSASHGGSITGNGQKVKIGYVHYKNKNFIVRIETITN